MIAARQIAFGKAAGAAKPYKARLEYLESTGTQYIDTEYAMKSSTKYEIGFSCTSSNSASKMLFGIYSIRSTLDGIYRAQCDNFTANCFGSWNQIEVKLFLYFYPNNGEPDGYPENPQTISRAVSQNYGEKNTIAFDGGVVLFNGEEIANRPSSMPDNPFEIPAYLFACCVRQADASNKPGYFFEGRIMDLKIRDSDYTLVRSLIPVLDYNDIACMYDEVSGKFFYNKGTGAFIAGPKI